ncbi:MAG: restriction endonuclease subunit S [Atopobiaceae bacterium]|nr:restriction endonuclease subunit S [Atopobiaceae bacterium]
MREMKDSGIPWVGEIPANWRTMRLKYLLSERNSRTTTGDEELLSVSIHNGVVPSRFIRERATLASSLVGYKHVYVGDMVFNKLNPNMARFAYSEYDGITSPDFAVYYPKEPVSIDMRFLTYLIRTPLYVERIKQLTSGVGEGFARLYTPDLFGIAVGLPSLNEQLRIADYLDERCAAIDEVRRTIEDEVEVLRRLRKATIHRAVTKGLDEGAPMQDSGIHWAGRVPSAFEVKQLKRVAWLGNGSDPKMDGNTPVYGSGQESFKTCGEYKLGPCVLLGRKGATLHIPHYIEGRYWNVDTAFDAKTIGLNCLKWFYYLACCLDYDYYKTHTVRPSMTASDYLSMVIPVPSVIEQNRIADYLDERCAAIDSVIDTRTKQLERLEDYRKALIFAYVTGKKEVPTHA